MIKFWFDLIRKKVGENVEVRLVLNDTDGAYCRSIHHGDGFYDVVIVDGRDRVNCVKQAIGRLTPSGVILLDDSLRERYSEAFRVTLERGFRSLDFEGLKPTGISLERTTLFYRSNNCLNL